MSSDEFWHGKPRLAESYRKADAVRRENAYVSEWRAGVYVWEALITASPLYREFSEGIDHPYPQKPLFGELADKPLTEEERRKAEMERNMQVFKVMAEKANEALAERRERQGEDS